MEFTQYYLNTNESSDSDKEVNPHVLNADKKYQLNNNKIYMGMAEFLSEKNGKYINGKNDETTNIVDMYGILGHEDTKLNNEAIKKRGRCFNIPEKKIKYFFNHLETCRRYGLTTSFYEKIPNDKPSGIMIDIDIKQKKPNSQLSEKNHFKGLARAVLKTLVKHLKIEDNHDIYIGITRKPKPKYNEEKKYYSDGFHLLIPSIKLKKNVKKFILQKLIESEQMEKIFNDIELLDGMKPSDILDTNCAHVGVFFIGCKSKLDNPAYELVKVYEERLTRNMDTDYIDLDSVDNEKFINNEKINLCYEFSLNWQVPSSKAAIKKKLYEPKKKYLDAINIASRKFRDITLKEYDMKYYSDYSILTVHDPQASFVKDLIDCLEIDRAINYNTWRDIIYILANTSPSYKPLADYFSRKCLDSENAEDHKYNPMELDKIWNEALKNKDKGHKITMGSLRYYAKLDNKDRYGEVVKGFTYNKVYDILVNGLAEGNLEHADIADLIYDHAESKYKVEYLPGERKATWYEFMFPEDRYNAGELYKWVPLKKPPTSLYKFISRKLPGIFQNYIYPKLKARKDESTDINAKFYQKVLNGFRSTYRKLKNTHNVRGIMDACEYIFEERGFSEKLDQNPLLFGVRNGILHLSPEGPKIIKEYRDGIKVSKFTDVKYVSFDPYDKYQKKVLKWCRNLFPDNESDTHEFNMCVKAACLTNEKKEKHIYIKWGGGSNGKSADAEIHLSVIGEQYSCKTPAGFIMAQRSSAETATPALMKLKNARYTYVSELPEHPVLNVAKMKEITGDETLSGRGLFKDQVNFRVNTSIDILTNHKPILTDTTYAVGRRFKLIPYRIKFLRRNHENFDEDDPYIREIDDNFDLHDDDIKSAYLAILVFYYYKLKDKYNGKISNIPHPNIEKATQEYLSEQNKLEEYINCKFVKCKNKNEKMYLEDIVDMYTQWFKKKCPNRLLFKEGIKEQFKNSKIQKSIKCSNGREFIKGYKFIEDEDDMEDDDEFVYLTKDNQNAKDDMSNNEKKRLNTKSRKKKKKKSKKRQNKTYNSHTNYETTEDYYKRICKEYKEFEEKYLSRNSDKYDKLNRAESYEPIKLFKRKKSQIDESEEEKKESFKENDTSSEISSEEEN